MPKLSHNVEGALGRARPGRTSGPNFQSLDALTVTLYYVGRALCYALAEVDVALREEEQMERPLDLAATEIDTARGEIILIRNERGLVIGALTAEPQTGVERVLDAIRRYECPKGCANCISLARRSDSLLIFAPIAKRSELMKVMTAP